MPGHHLDMRRVKNRIERRGITINAKGRILGLCTTCPNRLDSVSRAQGCKRCKTCRTEHPGRPRRFRACPCGCGVEVQHGRIYALNACRLKCVAARAKPKPMPTESWWIGLSHEALNAEALRRHPGTDTGRPSMPTPHARGALKGR